MVFTNEEAAMIEGVLSTYFTGANTAENVRSAYSCVWQHLAADALDAEDYRRISNAVDFAIKNHLRRFTKGYYIKQPNMDCQPTEFTALSRHRAVFSWAGKGGIPICGA